MNYLTMAAALIVASLAAPAARAGGDPPARDFRAAATDGAAPAPGANPGASGPDCRIERLSVIWGPDRQPGAYECYGRVNRP